MLSPTAWPSVIRQRMGNTGMDFSSIPVSFSDTLSRGYTAVGRSDAFGYYIHAVAHGMAKCHMPVFHLVGIVDNIQVTATLVAAYGALPYQHGMGIAAAGQIDTHKHSASQLAVGIIDNGLDGDCSRSRHCRWHSSPT
mgnify:CR=1 FL=1